MSKPGRGLRRSLSAISRIGLLLLAVLWAGLLPACAFLDQGTITYNVDLGQSTTSFIPHTVDGPQTIQYNGTIPGLQLISPGGGTAGEYKLSGTFTTAGTYTVIVNEFASGTLVVRWTYVVIVGGGGGGTVRPGNDTIQSAQLINGSSAVIDGSNVGAINNTVYWRWVATGSGSCVIGTSGSSFNTVLFILDSSGNQIASNDDASGGTFSQCSFSVTSGSTYYFAVNGYQGASGSISLSLSFTSSSSGGSGGDTSDGYYQSAGDAYNTAGSYFNNGDTATGYYWIAYFYYYYYSYEVASTGSGDSSNLYNFYECLGFYYFVSYANQGNYPAAYAWYNYLHSYAVRY